MNILPNRFLGVVGEHDGFPVESLSLSHTGDMIASCSHDHKVKFFSVSELENISVNTKRKAKQSIKSTPLKSAKHSDFFSDLVEDKSVDCDSLDDSESDSSEEDE